MALIFSGKSKCVVCGKTFMSQDEMVGLPLLDTKRTTFEKTEYYKEMESKFGKPK
jgi:hypothetical protein